MNRWATSPAFWLARCDDWLQRMLPNRRSRYRLALLVVVVLIFPTRGKILLPFTVGWSTARALVEKEDEIAHLRREAAEYHTAAAFFRTPAGREYALKLMYNRLAPGERRIAVELVEQEDAQVCAAGRLRNWLATRGQQLADSARYVLRVLKRWAVDPPDSPHPHR